MLQKILTVHHGDAASDHVLELAAELAKRTKASLLGLAMADTQVEGSRDLWTDAWVFAIPPGRNRVHGTVGFHRN